MNKSNNLSYFNLEKENEIMFWVMKTEYVSLTDDDTDVMFLDCIFDDIESASQYVVNKNKRTSRKMNINELHKIIELLDKGYTQVEISKMFGYSQNTVKKKIHRMREVIMEIKNNE